MFKKVLIANRGEIACRIIRTLQKMGIQAVAVYSHADENALHVEMADEAYSIGPSPAKDSYLNGPKIIEVAKASGVEAIHPGYGFLSENADFAGAVIDAGLVFIGPSPQAIALMGDKLEAKRLANSAGVPCIKGMETALKDLSEAQEVARTIGYPLMVKAAAGGGGKGMRIVREAKELEQAFKGAQNEAESSFGDGRLFIEQYIDTPRHIEIQVLADSRGNTIYLGERECSLQRRHQKVIEEAPSPFVTDEMRRSMGEAAVSLTKAVGYTSAGTVEFVVNQKREFFFLEMNTRLQVEHTVTEMVTGIDMVEAMVHIAVGRPLALSQADVHIQGHGIEARIYAEDSSKGFLPSMGRISTYIPTQAIQGSVRIDSGVEEGSEVTPFYDPMLAKLIVHQEDRTQAVQSLLSSLDHYYIRGIETNIAFLSALADSSEFSRGEFSTTTLDEEYRDGFTPCVPQNFDLPIAVAAVMYLIRKGLFEAKVAVFIEGEDVEVGVSRKRDVYTIAGKSNHTLETCWRAQDLLFEGVFNGKPVTLQIDALGIKDRLSWHGNSVVVRVLNPSLSSYIKRMPTKVHAKQEDILKAPMPGCVVEIFVGEGEEIKAGQPLLAIEAMKMENVMRAPREGRVDKIYVARGESVNLDQSLVKLK